MANGDRERPEKEVREDFGKSFTHERPEPPKPAPTERPTVGEGDSDSDE